MDTQNLNLEPQKKKGKKSSVGFIIGIVLGTVLTVLGLGLMFMPDEGTKSKNEDPVDIFYATDEDQYCSAQVQYLTESFATFNAHEQLNVYLGFDVESNPYVVAIKDKDLEQFQKYIDYMYSEEEVPLPEMMTITGYAKEIDTQMREFLVEYYNELFGEELMTMEDSADWTGEYYLNYGELVGTYRDNTASYIFIGIGLFLAFFFSFLFAKQRKEEQNAELNLGNTSYSAYQSETTTEEGFVTKGGNGEIVSINYGLGILGAIIGALAASGLWFFCSMIEIIAGIVAFAAVYIPIYLFKKFGGGINRTFMFLSAFIGLAMLIPANFIAYGYVYYKELNEVMNVPFTFFEALEGLPSLMSDNDLWIHFWRDLGIGYVLGLACFPWNRKGKGNKRSVSQNANINQEETSYSVQDSQEIDSGKENRLE